MPYMSYDVNFGRKLMYMANNNNNTITKSASIFKYEIND
jgi:hypothetical protein